MVVEFSITPIGKGESVGKHVARATRVVRASGLRNELHAMGTIVEGTWDEVFDVIRKCHDELASDCRRISIAIKVDSRVGGAGRLRKKVASVEKRL
ncbi:MAG TPA: MTH1187 family thiamine-binding protein [Thermoplasmata archaeon]|nr:MTH1187 family thiamine-binding protein [Thermoplasmata archaeon]